MSTPDGAVLSAGADPLSPVFACSGFWSALTGATSAEWASGGVFAHADIEAAPQSAIETARVSTTKKDRRGRRIGVPGIETYGGQVNLRIRSGDSERACLIDCNARAILYIARRNPVGCAPNHDIGLSAGSARYPRWSRVRPGPHRGRQISRSTALERREGLSVRVRLGSHRQPARP